MKVVRSIVELKMPLLRFEVEARVDDSATPEQMREWADTVAPITGEIIAAGVAELVVKAVTADIRIRPDSLPIEIGGRTYKLADDPAESAGQAEDHAAGSDGLADAGPDTPDSSGGALGGQGGG